MIHRPLSTAFLDLFCNLALIFLLLINPNKSAQTETPFDIAIYLKWDDGLNTDMDIYVEGPDRKVLFYQRKDTVWATLSKDDLGDRNDKSQKNLEVVEFRAPSDGTYWISVHTYARPTEGTVSLELWERRGGEKARWASPIPTSGGRETGVWKIKVKENKVVEVESSTLLIRKKMGYPG